MIKAPQRAAFGFTLLELLMALIIFGLISVMTYRGLNSVLQSRDHLAAESSKWRDVALLFARMERDLNQLTKRPVRDVNDLSAAPLVANPTLQGEHDAQLMFTRMGFPEQGNVLAGPVRGGYRLRAGVVEQLLWPSPDAAPRATPAVNALMENVVALEFHYLDSAGAWHTRWPLPGAAFEFPRALQAVIELKSKERVTRIFALPVLQ